MLCSQAAVLLAGSKLAQLLLQAHIAHIMQACCIGDITPN
jgi:hypothetical protein